jgi:uncharacterized delta-60 repeat protein
VLAVAVQDQSLRSYFGVASYLNTGQPDGSFNGGAGVNRAPFDLSFSAQPFAVALGPDNSIEEAGIVYSGSGSFVMGLARFSDSGSRRGQPDLAFHGGTVTTAINSRDYASAVTVQPDGEIVVAGNTFASSLLSANQQFVVARYKTDGSLDTTFDPTGTLPGVVTTSFYGQGDQAAGIALQPDGNIVVAGKATVPNGDAAFALARYLGTSGTVQITPPATVIEGQAATITITRSDTSGPASVTFTTSDGTAHAGIDYTPVIQTVSFAPGPANATVTVPTLDDGSHAFDPTVTVNLALSSPSGVALGAQSTGVLAIQVPAASATIQFGQASYVIGDNGGSISNPVTRSGDTSGAASVNVTVMGGSATPGRDF